MPGTTSRGFRYHLNTEPLHQIADATKRLADDVNAKIGAVAIGKSSVNVPSGSDFGTLNIVFPVGRFSAAPALVATTQNRFFFASVSAITAAGATLTVEQLNNTAGGALAVAVDWIAVQQ